MGISTTPSVWTMERGLEGYLRENGFSREEYDAPSVKITALGVTFPLPNPPQRKRAVRLHDLHHVITGYGTDLAGEAEVSAWELRRGLAGLGLFVRALVILGAVGGLFHSPRRTLAAWRASGDGDNFFNVSLEDTYPKLLAQTVGELREALGVPSEGLVASHGVHDGAPRPGTSPAEA